MDGRLFCRPMRCRAGFLVLVCLLMAVALGGCKSKQVKPDYARELMPGERALMKVSPADWPDIATALSSNRENVIEALRNSEQWYTVPSAKTHFPVEGITHEQAAASTTALRQLLESTSSPDLAANRIARMFDLYQSVGYDRKGTVLFTGYYTPIFEASKTRTGPYQYPLYNRPDDLVSDPSTGKVLGRKTSAGLMPYPSRREFEQSGELKGLELVYLKDPFQVYLVHLQGSARLRMPDGSAMYVGYGGTNGHDYVSVARELVKDGKIDEDEISLPVVRDYFYRHPRELDVYVNRNPRFVFFQPTTPDRWPLGSLGFPVTREASVATDKSIFPRGMPVFAQTRWANTSGSGRQTVKLLVDQDTGGAIRAPGRADIYFGIGDRAEQIAGNQHAEGQLYYLVLKPQQVGDVQQTPASAPMPANQGGAGSSTAGGFEH